MNYKREPLANVQIGTEQPTPGIMLTDVGGNTSIHYQSDRISIFVLIPKGMAVLAPYQGEADLTKNPEHVVIAPKREPIILESSTVLRPLAVQVVSTAQVGNERSWAESLKIVSRQIDLPSEYLGRALKDWYPHAETPTDRALSALCRWDVLTAEKEALIAESDPNENPQDMAILRMVLSQSEYARGNYSSSVRNASQAVALQPSNRTFTRYLGYSLKEAGDTPGAAAAFLASGCSRDRPACNNISETLSTFSAAMALETLGYKRDAIGEYRRVVKSTVHPWTGGLEEEFYPAVVSRERLPILESELELELRSFPSFEWWIGIALLLSLLIAGASRYAWGQMLIRSNEIVVRVTRRINDIAGTKKAARRVAFWMPLTVVLALTGLIAFIYFDRKVSRDLQVRPTQIVGTVSDESHQPIANATVRVLDFGPQPVQTDSDGHFHIELPTGPVAFVLVQAQKNGFTPDVVWTNSSTTTRVVLHRD